MAGAKSKETAFKLPRYLRLNRGSMWFDVEGENSSGVKLYAVSSAFVGRGSYPSNKEVDAIKKRTGSIPTVPEVPKDKFGNQNFVDYGYVSVDKNKLPWYVDTQKIPNEKLSRIILAFKHGILVEADPNNPPEQPETVTQVKEFKLNTKGERVFVGQNKEMYKKLQGLAFDDLRSFIQSFPKNEDAKNNLIDLFHYEQKGYNRLERPRIEVLDLIRAKLKEFGPSISAIRVNED
jgi:hypothetical protein